MSDVESVASSASADALQQMTQQLAAMQLLNAQQAAQLAAQVEANPMQAVQLAATQIGTRHALLQVNFVFMKMNLNSSLI
jgi:hypothetical protein